MGILRTEGLRKTFGELVAVDGVSLDFEERKITAIIGPNGAGKSTFFNLVSGRNRPTEGDVFFKDEKITGLPSYKILRKGIGRSFQITNIFRGLTVFENIRIGVLAHSGKSSKLSSPVEEMKDISESVLKFLEAVGLLDEKDTVASTLSHGDQKRLEIALTLTCQPKLLLLDEPTAGMNPGETKELTHIIQDIAKEQGISVIFSEHDMGVVFSISDRIIVMQLGRVIADGSAEQVRSNPHVRKAYLGVEE